MASPKLEKASGITNDSPSSEDLLGFSPYVKALAYFLTDKHTTPPLTISIEGEWGSGKSSFLEQLDAELRKESVNTAAAGIFKNWLLKTKLYKRIELNAFLRRPYYSIKFNPWRYSEHETLWAAFAIEFERQLNRQLFFTLKLPSLSFFLKRLSWKKLTIQLLSFSLLCLFVGVSNSFFFKDPGLIYQTLISGNLITIISLVKNHLFGFVIALIPFLPFVKFSLSIWKTFSLEPLKIDIGQYIRQRPDYEKSAPLLQKFHDDFKTMVQTFISKKERVYVFIEDLDRCEPIKAVELMQAINLLISDELNIVFLLGIDRKTIAAGYTAKQEQIIKYLEPNLQQRNEQTSHILSLRHGYDFLEKFIQLPFQLPLPTEAAIQKFFMSLVKLKAQEKSRFSTLFPQKKVELDNSIRPLAKKVDFEDLALESTLILEMVSPFLNNNPRSIKKFLNLFRLKIYIATQTGLFGVSFEGKVQEIGLTVYQLGKFLVISQKWPHFIESWLKYPYLPFCLDFYKKGNTKEEKLREILYGFVEDSTTSNSRDREVFIETFSFWQKEKELIELISYKSDQGENAKTYSLKDFPIHKVLAVSPVYITKADE